jgi:cytochrome c oxidase subunit 2
MDDAASHSHFRRMALIWLACSVVATPLVVILLAPMVPPGDASVQAAGQGTDNTVLLGIVTPVMLAIVVYFAYALIVFRERGDAALEGPPVRGDRRVQLTWIVATSAIVLFLAGFGSFELLKDGSGGGQGPNPIAPADPPAQKPLQVQVIAQQWQFTYRYPSYGGVETPHLVLPEGRTVELHVTSLDVIHSFWAYQLGVKADANPGVDNVAYVQPQHVRTFDIHCAELCGLWHGYMFDKGQVVTQRRFASWIAQQRRTFAPVHKSLPPYSKAYFPDPQRRGG